MELAYGHKNTVSTQKQLNRIMDANDMRYADIRTKKFSTEHTSVGLTHAHPINPDPENLQNQ